MDDARTGRTSPARITNLALSPTGKRVLAEARGEIFTIPAEKGDTRNLTRSSASAERDPAWSPDGKSIAYFSDRSGEYQLVIEDPSGVKPRALDRRCRTRPTTTPSSWSPDSKKILYHDTDLHVWVLDVASGKAKLVGNDPWMVPARTLFPTWSPDSRYVAYASHLNTLYRAIFIADVETGESRGRSPTGLPTPCIPCGTRAASTCGSSPRRVTRLRSQWLDMTSYEHEETLRALLRGPQEGRRLARCFPRATRMPASSAAAAGDSGAEVPRGPARRPRAATRSHRTRRA